MGDGIGSASGLRRVDGPAGPVRAVCHLVVGVDRHPSGHAVLAHAIDLADRLHAYLHVVHVIDLEDAPIDPDDHDWDRRLADAADSRRESACAALADSPGNWTYYSGPGDPVRVLKDLAHANDALMIVIGASRGGASALMRRLVGESVSTTLTHHPDRPVLLVPVTGRDS
ncbi:universal stress protein [Nocardia arizonensis]|uniref:universal stress protein n=1 Tax=Nocardia arizonensis TaxID=1141647 RepID=UPI0006CF3BC0|nr:universal stress protein [Nocardia arizonensis]